MELTQLRYFCEVAQTQHITMSAQRLHIAQPALTQTIHRLESELGVKLFARRGRSIELTEYGKYAYNQLKPAIDAISALPDTLSAMAGYSERTINVNMPAASIIITQAIISYRKINRDAQFQVHQNEEQGAYDIDVSTQLRCKRVENNLQRIFTENIYLAVPRNEKYRNRVEISLNEVMDENFISLTGSRQYRSICDRMCASAGFTPHIIFESDSPASVRDLISANVGVGFWPEFTWGALDAGDMLLLPISDAEHRRDIIVSFNKDRLDHRQAFVFYEYLTKFCQDIFSHSSGSEYSTQQGATAFPETSDRQNQALE